MRTWTTFDDVIRWEFRACWADTRSWEWCLEKGLSFIEEQKNLFDKLESSLGFHQLDRFSHLMQDIFFNLLPWPFHPSRHFRCKSIYRRRWKELVHQLWIVKQLCIPKFNSLHVCKDNCHILHNQLRWVIFGHNFHFFILVISSMISMSHILKDKVECRKSEDLRAFSP